jgi:hypothetical protein
VRRRAASVPRRFLAAGAATLALAVALVLTVGNLRAPADVMNPAALQHIEAQNRRAALKAAAVQRAASAQAAEAADRAAALRETEANGAAVALTQFDSQAPAATR